MRRKTSAIAFGFLISQRRSLDMQILTREKIKTAYREL